MQRRPMPQERTGETTHSVALGPATDGARLGIPTAAWGASIAMIGAWPGGEAVSAAIERRIWRDARTGPLKQAVIGVHFDPLGLCDPAQARCHVREMMRPLWSSCPLPALSREAHRRLLEPRAGWVAEIRRLDPLIPEGNEVLGHLFTGMLTALEGIDGPVGISFLATSEPAGDEREAEALEGSARGAGMDSSERSPWGPVRQVDFRVRLFAPGPIHPGLRACVEALCLARRAQPGDWHVALEPDQVAAARKAIAGFRPVATSPSRSGTPSHTAAVTLALDGPISAVPSVPERPLSGPATENGRVITSVLAELFPLFPGGR